MVFAGEIRDLVLFLDLALVLALVPVNILVKNLEKIRWNYTVLVPLLVVL